MSVLKFESSIRKFYRKYKNYITFNKELGIAEVVSLATGAVAAQLAFAFTRDPFINSIASLVGDYGGSYSTFFLTHYYDNKKTYKKSKWKLIKDIFKISPFLAVAEPIYIFSKGSLHYILITTFGVIPFLASIISDLVATGLFVLIANIGAKVTGFVRSK